MDGKTPGGERVMTILTGTWLALLVVHGGLLAKAIFREEGTLVELREHIWVCTCTIMAYLCSHL